MQNLNSLQRSCLLGINQEKYECRFSQETCWASQLCRTEKLLKLLRPQRAYRLRCINTQLKQLKRKNQNVQNQNPCFKLIMLLYSSTKIQYYNLQQNHKLFCQFSFLSFIDYISRGVWRDRGSQIANVSSKTLCYDST